MKYTIDQFRTIIDVCLILNDEPSVDMEKLLWREKAVGINLKTNEILCDPNYVDKKTYYALLGYSVEAEFILKFAPMPIVDNLN